MLIHSEGEETRATCHSKFREHHRTRLSNLRTQIVQNKEVVSIQEGNNRLTAQKRREGEGKGREGEQRKREMGGGKD